MTEQEFSEKRYTTDEAVCPWCQGIDYQVYDYWYEHGVTARVDCKCGASWYERYDHPTLETIITEPGEPEPELTAEEQEIVIEAPHNWQSAVTKIGELMSRSRRKKGGA